MSHKVLSQREEIKHCTKCEDGWVDDVLCEDCEGTGKVIVRTIVLQYPFSTGTKPITFE